MKKLATLLIAAGLVFGASTGASAIDFKAKGQWIMSFDMGQHGDFAKAKGQGYKDSDEFDAQQRVRIGVEAVASENLSGTVFFEIGNQRWGKNSQGGAVGADGKVVEVKHAYLDWMIPETTVKVRMGIQPVALPSFAMKASQVLDDDAAGITVSAKFNDNVGLTVGWARLWNDNYTNDQKTYPSSWKKTNYMDNIDMGYLTLPLSFDGVKVTPWFAMTAIGPNAFRGEVTKKDGTKYESNFGNRSTTGAAADWMYGLIPAFDTIGKGGQKLTTVKNDTYATAWWAGVTADVTYWDPFRVALDFAAGGVQWDNSRLNRAGWMAALLLEYKMDWGIPGLVAWYTSGDDDDLGNGSERMPTLSNNGNNQFSPFAGNGYTEIQREGVLSNTVVGTWGVGLRVTEVSFLEDLKHSLRINYIGGTNSHDIYKKLRTVEGSVGKTSVVYDPCKGSFFNGVYMTDLDSAWEIALGNEYKMFDNFKIKLDAAYVALNLQSNGYRKGFGSRDTNDAWNVNASFIYSF